MLDIAFLKSYFSTLERLFKQQEQLENGKFQLKKGTSYHHQGHTHSNKGYLTIPRGNHRYELSYELLETPREQGYKCSLAAQLNHCLHPHLFIIAPRKSFSKVMKPKASINYRLLCQNETLSQLLHEHERLHEVYALAEAQKIEPWIQGCTEDKTYHIRVQYSYHRPDEDFYLATFGLLKALSQSLLSH